MLPYSELILQLPSIGQTIFQLSMANGSVIYVLLATVAVTVYAYRLLGLKQLLCFMVSAVGLSLGSELL